MARLRTSCGNTILIPGTVNWKLELSLFQALVPDNNLNKEFAGLSTVPVFCNGNRIFEYDKKMNDRNFDRNTDAVFVRGIKGQTFQEQGLAFGIEVCGDYAESNLAASTDGQLDVEILISNTIAHSFSDVNLDKVPVRNGGAFIHCDATGANEKNALWIINRGAGLHGTPAMRVDAQGIAHADPAGMRLAMEGAGNVNTIGRLVPNPDYDNLVAFAASI